MLLWIGRLIQVLCLLGFLGWLGAVHSYLNPVPVVTLEFQDNIKRTLTAQEVPPQYIEKVQERIPLEQSEIESLNQFQIDAIQSMESLYQARSTMAQLSHQISSLAAVILPLLLIAGLSLASYLKSKAAANLTMESPN